MSVPTTLYSTIKFDPALPVAKQRLANENQSGHTCKLVYVFREPWWQNLGLSGVLRAKQGPILFARDTSLPAANQWSITCFLSCERGRQWSQLPDAERRQGAWSHFQAMINGAGVLDISQPLNVLESDWTKGSLRGGPCTVSPPGLLTSVGGKAQREPFGNIHFVGTETSFSWKGYMEGAVQSGIRGAREVVTALGKGNALRSTL